MNDATVDVAIEDGERQQPSRRRALPVRASSPSSTSTGTTSGRSTLGYSRMRHRQLRRPDGDSAFKTGQYALVNLLYYPAPNVMLGPEVQCGRRENNTDGWNVDDFRVQFSVKYNFSYSTRR